MSRPANVLVFDSGAGGLTIAREILKKVPSLNLIYASDRAFFPYGEKDADTLITRIVTQLEGLIPAHIPDIVVLACNTASTIALDILRSEFSCQFIGVVPAIKPAAQITQTGVIGLLATPATANRQYTIDLVKAFAQGRQVIRYGSNKLVTLAEGFIVSEGVDKTAVQQELEALFCQPGGKQIDTIVLACTHFPILKAQLDDVCKSQGRSITWVDSGEAIARRTEYLLSQIPEIQLSEDRQGNIQFIDSLNNVAARRLSEHYLRFLQNA